MQAGLVSGKWPTLSKNCTIEEYRRQLEGHGSYNIEKALVTESVELSAEEWEKFTHSLMADRDWLKGKGGTDSVAQGEWRDTPVHTWTWEQITVFRSGAYRLVIEVIGPDEFIYVDPQGYNYARYVGFPTEAEPSRVGPLALDEPEPEEPTKEPEKDPKLPSRAKALLSLLDDTSTVDDW